MTVQQRISAFCKLGKRLQNLSGDEQTLLIEQIKRENPWFTDTNVKMAVLSISSMLDQDALEKWIAPYAFDNKSPKTIALVLAGNIPLVGFHDLLCVLISGHRALVKTSSKDSASFHFVVDELLAIEPRFREYITVTERLKDFDAVIATGSDNSSRYFDYYFGKYPNIIRKNRTSCAILVGDESENDLYQLGMDVFSYFGLGCRNVSKLFVPVNYNVSSILDRWEKFNAIQHHHKYVNNYDYQKSIMLVNGIPFLDNGFVMLTESNKSVSPISVIYYEYYYDQHDLKQKITTVHDKLQCIVGKSLPATIPFGQAQHPALWDYADGVNTLEFLKFKI